MRAWVLMRHFRIAFEEVMLRFDGFSPQSQFKQRLSEISPAGQVPVLVDDKLVVWDTLAIAEYLAETFSQRNLWPQKSFKSFEPTSTFFMITAVDIAQWQDVGVQTSANESASNCCYCCVCEC